MLLTKARSDLDAVQQLASDTEKESAANKTDLMALQDKSDMARQAIMVMEKQLKTNETCVRGPILLCLSATLKLGLEGSNDVICISLA